jgi:hypothetical protein
MILDSQRRRAMGDNEKRTGAGRRTTKERRSGTDTRSEKEKQLIGERRSSPPLREQIGLNDRRGPIVLAIILSIGAVFAEPQPSSANHVS